MTSLKLLIPIAILSTILLASMVFVENPVDDANFLHHRLVRQVGAGKVRQAGGTRGKINAVAGGAKQAAKNAAAKTGNAIKSAGSKVKNAIKPKTSQKTPPSSRPVSPVSIGKNPIAGRITNPDR